MADNNYALKLILFIYLGLFLWFMPRYLANNFDFFDYELIRNMSGVFLLFFSIAMFSVEKKSIAYLAVIIVWSIVILAGILIKPEIINFIDYPQISMSYSGRDLIIEAKEDKNIEYIIDKKAFYGISSTTIGSFVDEYQLISSKHYSPSCSGGMGGGAEQCDDSNYTESTYATPFGKILYGEDFNSGDDWIVIYPNNLYIRDVMNKDVLNVLNKNNKINQIYIHTGKSRLDASIGITTKDKKIVSIAF